MIFIIGLMCAVVTAVVFYFITDANIREMKDAIADAEWALEYRDTRITQLVEKLQTRDDIIDSLERNLTTALTQLNVESASVHQLKYDLRRVRGELSEGEAS